MSWGLFPARVCSLVCGSASLRTLRNLDLLTSVVFLWGLHLHQGLHSFCQLFHNCYWPLSNVSLYVSKSFPTCCCWIEALSKQLFYVPVFKNNRVSLIGAFPWHVSQVELLFFFSFIQSLLHHCISFRQEKFWLEILVDVLVYLTLYWGPGCLQTVVGFFRFCAPLLGI